MSIIKAWISVLLARTPSAAGVLVSIVCFLAHTLPASAACGGLVEPQDIDAVAWAYNPFPLLYPPTFVQLDRVGQLSRAGPVARGVRYTYVRPPLTERATNPTLMLESAATLLAENGFFRFNPPPRPAGLDEAYYAIIAQRCHVTTQIVSFGLRDPLFRRMFEGLQQLSDSMEWSRVADVYAPARLPTLQFPAPAPGVTFAPRTAAARPTTSP